ncbi:MAG: IS110 family transposase, partial [Rhodocyclaceae bacterium]|nr:IS110 family transposase [Rhodocyclaceae bacterium]
MTVITQGRGTRVQPISASGEEQVNLIGIDVDSRNLVCRIRRDGKDHPEKIFTNDAAGFGKLIRWATQRGAQARVCMEATGVYSMPLALALHQAPAIEVMVVNPKVIKHFTTANLQRGKTDSLDAASILEFLQRMPFRPWQPPSDEVLELQHICRRIVQLNTELTRERNRHKQARRLGSWGRVVAHDTQVNMNHLQRRIDHLETTALALVESVPELAERLRLLTSTTGIAAKTGPRILAELMALPDGMRPEQWVAHAGLDPRAHESGSSTHKPRRISKAGNRYLRDALYFPALVACRYDPNVKAYYDKLIERGKKPKQVLVAVMRKLLL